MRRAAALLMAAVLIVLGADTSLGAPRKYKVTTKIDKRTDFSRLKTYVWDRGRPSYDATLHAQVVAAVDRELGALGLTKRSSEPADVVVTYAAVERLDVDLKSKLRGPRGERPTYPVASLLVLLRHPVTSRELFLARVALPIDSSPEAIQARVSERVAKIFDRYPTRH
jgi:hypothetical protein